MHRAAERTGGIASADGTDAHAAARTLVSLERALRELSHDLRAPFVALDAHVELLATETGPSDPAVAARLAEMRRACSHGLALLESLAREALPHDVDARTLRAERPDEHASDRAVDLRGLLAEIVALFSADAARRALSIELEVDPELPAWIEIDAAALRRILANLVGNAVKFTDRGRVLVIARGARHAACAGTCKGRAGACTRRAPRLEIAVVDDGPGIEESVLPVLFDPALRAARAVPRERAGLGLGLAIAARLSRCLEGILEAANRAEGGALFTLRVPLRVARTDEIGVGAEIDPTRRADPRPAAPARDAGPTTFLALVVDDSEPAARLLAHHLASAGAVVRHARTLREARNAIAAERFDLVVSDEELPDGSGAAFGDELADLAGAHGETRKPRFVLSSAVEAGSSRSRHEFLAKPVRAESVRALLRAA